MIDSGINDSHPDLWNSSADRIARGLSPGLHGTPTTNSNGANYDLYGHGTHVAGIIGGNGSFSGGQYAGRRPGVNLIDLRALDANGAGSDSTVIAAIQQAIALQEHLQHPRHQPLAGPRNSGQLHARSSLPGG